jgi:AraC family transcriptional regulator, melibiose operon regulatory protein
MAHGKILFLFLYVALDLASKNRKVRPISDQNIPEKLDAMTQIRYPGFPDYVDESTPVHPGMDAGYPVVVFGDHKLCAGNSRRVQRMPGPHMHSQIEFNLLSQGFMTYWFDGREVRLEAGQMAVFWGMIPHQVIDCAAQTEFIVVYVPMSAFLEFPDLNVLRQKIFAGGLLHAKGLKAYDIDVFQRWREDLISGDEYLEPLVRDELVARLRRLDRDGWVDLREAASTRSRPVHHDPDHERAFKVEQMARFIGEHALDDLTVEQVAKSVSLNPKYAMTLYKQTMGMTIKQTILRHRLDTARSMLISNDLPVATISYDCGFGSLSSFYEAFNTRFRASPAEFRKSILRERVI